MEGGLPGCSCSICAEDDRRREMSNCQRCQDTGLWQYDDVHAQPCPDCCPHNQGVWMLTFEYGDAGKWCCKAGCGTKWDGIIDFQQSRRNVHR